MTRCREVAALFTLLATSFVSAIARNAHLPIRATVSEALSHNDSHTTLFSSDNYLKCTSTIHLTPRTTQELSDLIRLHTARHKHLKIRATRRGFHSSAGFVCAGRRRSSKRAHRSEAEAHDAAAVAVLLQLMNRAVDVDRACRRVTVEAGMTLLELVALAERHAMAVPPGALSMYGGLTVGGAVMAGAHGSGLGAVSALNDLVTSVKFVNAKGEILVSDEAPVALGLLGIATEFTLQLRENSRTVVETRRAASDVAMVEDVKRILARETPHVIVHWRPDSGAYKAVLMRDAGVVAVAPRFCPRARRASDAPVDERDAAVWSEMMVAWEENSSEAPNADICRLGEVLLNGPLHTDADGTPLPRGTFPTNSAVVTGDCSPKCAFNVHHTGIFTDDTEFTIKLSYLQDWIHDVKTVVNTELEPGECMPPGYIWLRFGRGTSRLFATNVSSEDVVYVQWTHWHSAMVPGKLPKRSAVAETLEQLTLCKYKGRPHWGKNHERVFRHPKCTVVENYPSGSVGELLEVQRRHDPGKVFEPALFGEVLEGAGPEYYPSCAVDFWCYCEGDSHCPEGFACGAARSFPEYRVCRRSEEEDGEL